MLERELRKYNQTKTQLQKDNPDGGFVVIRDDEVLGVWKTRVDALNAGLEKYGNVAFLVKDINEGAVAANLTRDLKIV